MELALINGSRSVCGLTNGLCSMRCMCMNMQVLVSGWRIAITDDMLFCALGMVFCASYNGSRNVLCACMNQCRCCLRWVIILYFLRSHAIDSVLVMSCGEEGRSFFDLALVGEVLHLQLHGFVSSVCCFFEKTACTQLVGNVYCVYFLDKLGWRTARSFGVLLSWFF